VAASKQLHRPWVNPPASPELFEAFALRMQGPANLGFLVRMTKTRQLVGFIAVTNIVRGVFQSAYLGYYAFAGHERQGLMTLAMRLLVKKAFSELHMHRLEANIQPENKASVALVRACGFVQEGYSERYLKIRGRWRDHVRWAILAR
jgi:ribosomal-protein-alanine N-acetyltransferase